MLKRILSASVAVLMLSTCLPAIADEGSADGSRPANIFSSNDAPGADQNFDAPAAVLGGTDYLFIAGSAFTPRTSGQTVTYPGGGCAYSDLALTTSLELPDAAVIEGVRLYYYSTSPTDNISLYMTTYPGDGTSTDVLTAASTLGTGYANEYFALGTPATLDNFSRSTVLTASMDANTRLCGMRVFYSP